jgi:hypothetical protein
MQCVIMLSVFVIRIGVLFMQVGNAMLVKNRFNNVFNYVTTND